MNKPVGEIKRGRKFDQVVEGARTIFLRDGYEGASVDEIAREAGVSKATLYAYFPEKRLLFLEMAMRECRHQALRHTEETDESLPPAILLPHAARRLIAFLTSDIGRSVFRICVAEADRFPELARRFYESGPMLVRARLVDYFRTAAARGELRIEDYELAADQFAELCKATFFPACALGACPPPDAAQIARVADGAVETFLARYGA